MNAMMTIDHWTYPIFISSCFLHYTHTQHTYGYQLSSSDFDEKVYIEQI